MTKITAGMILVALLNFPGSAFSQTPPTEKPSRTTATGRTQGDEQVDRSFCENDKRSEIRAFCENLAQLQSHVNNDTVSNLENGKTDLDGLDLHDPNNTEYYVIAIRGKLATNTAISSLLQDFGQSRPDQQLGASSNASGTTSLVSKAGSAELLDFALNTGAVTQSVNGTTATLNTNLDHVFRLITGNHPDCIVATKICKPGWFQTHVLNPTNISATIDLAQQSSKTTATSGQASGTTPTQVNNASIPTGSGRLSGITTRYQVMNKFDPRSDAFQEKWKTAVADSSGLKGAAASLLSGFDEVRQMLETSAPPLDAKARNGMLDKARLDKTGKALADAFAAYFENFENAPQSATDFQKLAAAVSQATQYQTAFRQAWSDTLAAAAGTLFTFEYSFEQPLNQPKSHDMKLIYAYNFESMGMLTFNGAFSLYGGAIPAGAKYGRIHDGQISGEYDRTLSGKNKSIQTQLSLAGYWQYQPDPSVLNIPAGTVAPGTTIPLPNGTQEFVGTAGSLWVAQAKITIKASGGINIPLGVSWSNKTDLLQGNKIGAQVGISYNFSSLAGLFSGGGGN